MSKNTLTDKEKVTLELYLTLFYYQCKTCHWTYFDTYDDCDCPMCNTENRPLQVAVYQKLKEESYENN